MNHFVIHFQLCHPMGFFNCYLNFLLLICMRITYSLNIYVTRFWYFICAGNFSEIDYWNELLCHIISTLTYKGFVNCYLKCILLICMCIAYLLNINIRTYWYSVCVGHLEETAYCLLIWTTFQYNSNYSIQGGWKINLSIHILSFNI